MDFNQDCEAIGCEREAIDYFGLCKKHKKKRSKMERPTTTEVRGPHGETAEEMAQAEKLAELLWGYLKRDPEHRDRRVTAWGTKTKLGLLRTVKAAMGGYTNQP